MPFIGGVGVRPLCLGGSGPHPCRAGQLLRSITNRSPLSQGSGSPLMALRGQHLSVRSLGGFPLRLLLHRRRPSPDGCAEAGTEKKPAVSGHKPLTLAINNLAAEHSVGLAFFAAAAAVAVAGRCFCLFHWEPYQAAMVVLCLIGRRIHSRVPSRLDSSFLTMTYRPPILVCLQ